MQRFFEIQQSLQVNKTNKGDGGRFYYRTAEQIIEELKPLLKKTKLTLTLTDKVEEIGGRIFLVASATLWSEKDVLMETTGVAELDQHLNNSGKKSMSNEQCTGSASSYARKYALCGMFAVDNGETDPDSIESLGTKIAEAKNAEDINALMAEVKDGTDDEKKAFKAKAKNLGLVFDEKAIKYVKQ